MVLLPSDYYEASVLQLQVTEPCTYSRRATRDKLIYTLYNKPVILGNSNVTVSIYNW